MVVLTPCFDRSGVVRVASKRKRNWVGSILLIIEGVADAYSGQRWRGYADAGLGFS